MFLPIAEQNQAVVVQDQLVPGQGDDQDGGEQPLGGPAGQDQAEQEGGVQPMDVDHGQLFPHSSQGERRRCQQCLDNLPKGRGSGRKAAKDKLAHPKFQCQMCAAATCEEHYVLVCQYCSLSLQRRPAAAVPGAEEMGE